MGTIIIKGSDKQLSIINRQNRARARKYGLVISVKDSTQEANELSVLNDLKSENESLLSQLESKDITINEGIESCNLLVSGKSEFESKHNTLLSECEYLKSRLKTADKEIGLQKEAKEVAENKLKALNEKPAIVTATETAKLIANCKTVEDLKKYETDTRQIAKAAYNKKLKELE